MHIKLSVLLNAIQAMQQAENLLPSTNPILFGNILASLCSARIDLKIAIGNIEITVEKDI